VSLVPDPQHAAAVPRCIRRTHVSELGEIPCDSLEVCGHASIGSDIGAHENEVNVERSHEHKSIRYAVKRGSAFNGISDSFDLPQRLSAPNTHS